MSYNYSSQQLLPKRGMGEGDLLGPRLGKHAHVNFFLRSASVCSVFCLCCWSQPICFLPVLELFPVECCTLLPHTPPHVSRCCSRHARVHMLYCALYFFLLFFRTFLHACAPRFCSSRILCPCITSCDDVASLVQRDYTRLETKRERLGEER